MRGARIAIIGCAAIAVVAVGVALVVSDSGADSDSPAVTQPQSASCNPLPKFQTPGKTILGRVRFPGYGTKSMPIGDELQIDPRANYDFSKVGLEVRGAETVVVQVPAKAQKSVDLEGWGSTQSGRFRADRITINLGDRCYGIWPGGFDFTRHQCLRLLVKADGRTAKIPFGLGKDC